MKIKKALGNLSGMIEWGKIKGMINGGKWVKIKGMINGGKIKGKING